MKDSSLPLVGLYLMSTVFYVYIVKNYEIYDHKPSNLTSSQDSREDTVYYSYFIFLKTKNETKEKDRISVHNVHSYHYVYV